MLVAVVQAPPKNFQQDAYWTLIKCSTLNMAPPFNFKDVDDDGSGTIGYEEFLKMMTHKILNRDPKESWKGRLVQ